MSKKNKLIPELRFPEFSENWDIVSVSDMCDVYRGGTFSKADMDENGSDSCIHYGELFTKYNEVISTIYSKTNKKEGFKSKVGDILMPSSDVTPDGLAKASAIMLADVVLGGDMNILRPKKKLNSIFLSYLLNHSKKEIIKLVSGTTVKHIYPSQIITCQLPIVNNKSEQEKIASCLSSLDDLIESHSQKLDLLKDHKKGLMQNLFPQEDEKVPKLRFKEFEKDREWIKTNVEKLIQENILFAPKDGNHGNIHPKSSDYVKTGIPFIMASDIKNGKVDFTKCAYLKKEQADSLQKGFAKVGDVLLTHKGTVGEVALVNELEFPYIMLTPQVTYYRIKEKSKMVNIYLATFFCSDSFQKNLLSVSGGGTRAYVGITEQQKLGIVYPKNIEEQKKIASCLSSLDEIITAQAEKIEQLKQHKKGLMQRLFPKIND